MDIYGIVEHSLSLVWRSEGNSVPKHSRQTVIPGIIRIIFQCYVFIDALMQSYAFDVGDQLEWMYYIHILSMFS